MANKDIERNKQQAPKAGQGQENIGGDGKNDPDIGEPVHLDEKKPDQQGKPGMGQREDQQGGQQPETQNR